MNQTPYSKGMSESLNENPAENIQINQLLKQ